MDDVSIVGRFNKKMKDLTTTTFCVPMMDKYSPIGLAIINEVHWYHPSAKHLGVETTLRYINQVAHIIDGRSIVKQRVVNIFRKR